jgi:hypothetical protein
MAKGSLELVLSSAAIVARPNKVLEYVWRKTAMQIVVGLPQSIFEVLLHQHIAQSV